MDNIIKSNKRFYAIFDNGLPACDRYGREKDGGNRWVGHRTMISRDHAAKWLRGEDVKFDIWHSYGAHEFVKADLYRVIVEETVVQEYNLISL